MKANLIDGESGGIGHYEKTAGPAKEHTPVIDHQTHGKLSAVQDWPRLVKTCGYRVGEAAARIGVSRQWLDRWFHHHFDAPVHKVFELWRREEAMRLAKAGLRGDSLAHALGFSSRGNLFRSLGGSTPPNKCSQAESGESKNAT